MLQEIDKQREQMQNDIQCVLDGLDEDIIDRVCQVVVDRCNILKTIYEEQYSTLSR